ASWRASTPPAPARRFDVTHARDNHTAPEIAYTAMYAIAQFRRPRSPTAEAEDLKSSQCGFESHRGHFTPNPTVGFGWNFFVTFVRLRAGFAGNRATCRTSHTILNR